VKVRAKCWVIHKRDVEIELQQAREEGRNPSDVEKLLGELNVPEVAEDQALQEKAGRAFDEIQRLPARADYPFVEPSGIREIQAVLTERPKLPDPPTDGDLLREKAHGAWTGRCAGCLLGKPVEGRRREQIETYLRKQGRWPLDDYFSGSADDAVRTACGFPPPESALYRETIRAMPEDDDTNYTTIGMAIVSDKGADLAPVDVANFWLRNLPFCHVFTAERIAYRNLINGLDVPDAEGRFEGEFSAASFRNPCREWIGAQIRADFFGYCRPADPAGAAELAWRDACVSHVANGIYGEMWVAAMLASAWVLDDVEQVIHAGLAEIPPRCRLREGIDKVFQWRADGLNYDEAVEQIHSTWDEANGHHWCHIISNAQIVAAALLWGQKDFGRTICLAVWPGFDTDCNGATAGSVLGLMLGRAGIGGAWADPLRDTLLTGVHGYHEVKLSEMADRTVEIIGRLGG